MLSPESILDVGKLVREKTSGRVGTLAYVVGGCPAIITVEYRDDTSEEYTSETTAIERCRSFVR